MFCVRISICDQDQEARVHNMEEERKEKKGELSREFRKRSRSQTPERIKRLRGDISAKTPKRIQNYRPEWQNNPSRSRWLRPVPGKSTRAQCILCKTDFKADISVIVNMRKEKNHTKIVQGIEFSFYFFRIFYLTFYC